MFKIEAIQSIEQQKAFASACGTVAVEGCFAYAMYDVETKQPMGFSQFDIAEGVGHIIDLKEAKGLSDFEAIAAYLGDELYFIQKFVDSGNLLGTGCSAFSYGEMQEILSVVRNHTPRASLRG